MKEDYPSYPIFKGLQMPLEFMGIRGRFIIWAAAIAGIGFLGFIAGYIIAGTIIAVIILFLIIAGGLLIIHIKQKKGLHSKKRNRGIYIYNNIIKV